MPTETPPDTDPQRYLLSTVRQSQAAAIDTIRTLTTITEQLTRTLRWSAPALDLVGAVDRVFDVAEQTLALQRQLALTVAGVATRQVDTAVETVDTAVAAVESTVDVGIRRVEREQRDSEQPQAPTGDTPTAESSKQTRKFDGRTYEERSIDELRERASELEIEGRSSMNKDELITALRDHRKARSARNDAVKQEHTLDRRTYEERTVEELRERAGELQIEGRSSMTKDELISALRKDSK